MHWLDLNEDGCPDLLLSSSASRAPLLSVTQLVNSCGARNDVFRPLQDEPNAEHSGLRAVIGTAPSLPAEQPMTVSALAADLDGDYRTDLLLLLSPARGRDRSSDGLSLDAPRSGNDSAACATERLALAAAARVLSPAAPLLSSCAVWELPQQQVLERALAVYHVAEFHSPVRHAGVRLGAPVLGVDWDLDGRLELLQAQTDGIALRYNSLRLRRPGEAELSPAAAPACLDVATSGPAAASPLTLCAMLQLGVLEAGVRPALVCLGSAFPRKMSVWRLGEGGLGLQDVTRLLHPRPVSSSRGGFKQSTPYFVQDACIGDLNGDGLGDYVIAALDRGVLVWMSRAPQPPAAYELSFLQPAWAEPWSPVSNFSQRAQALAVACLDADNNGQLDVFALYAPAPDGSSRGSSALFLNHGGQLRFAASLPATPGGSAVAVADYDNDGRLDLLVSDSRSLSLYRNELPQAAGQHWLELLLFGLPGNSAALGAVVELSAGDGQLRLQRILHQPSSSVRPYAQHHARLHFGLGQFAVVDELRISWPQRAGAGSSRSGQQPVVYSSVQADQQLLVPQLDASITRLPGVLRSRLLHYRFTGDVGLCSRQGERRLEPSFFILGGLGCGTGGLVAWLLRHPQVRSASTPSLHYFSRLQPDLSLDWYRQQFPCGGARLQSFDASPSYLLHRSAPGRLLAAFPSARLVVLLRDPVARALRQHLLELRRAGAGFESRRFHALVEEQRDEFLQCVRGRVQDASVEAAQLADSRVVPLPALSYCLGNGDGLVLGGLYAVALGRWRAVLGAKRRSHLLVLAAEQLQSAEAPPLLLHFLSLANARQRPGLQPGLLDQREPEAAMDADTERLLRVFYRPFNALLSPMLHLSMLDTPDWLQH